MRETSVEFEVALAVPARGRWHPPAGRNRPGPACGWPGLGLPGTLRSRSSGWRGSPRPRGRTGQVVPGPALGDVPTLECVLVDGSGEAIILVFLGRRSIPGVRNGTQMVADAMVGKHQGKLAMINPFYELLSASEPSDS